MFISTYNCFFLKYLCFVQLELIEGRIEGKASQQVGLLPLLDEELKVPKGR